MVCLGEAVLFVLVFIGLVLFGVLFVGYLRVVRGKGLVFIVVFLWISG